MLRGGSASVIRIGGDANWNGGPARAVLHGSSAGEILTGGGDGRGIFLVSLALALALDPALRTLLSGSFLSPSLLTFLLPLERFDGVPARLRLALPMLAVFGSLCPTLATRL